MKSQSPIINPKILIAHRKESGLCFSADDTDNKGEFVWERPVEQKQSFDVLLFKSVTWNKNRQKLQYENDGVSRIKNFFQIPGFQSSPVGEN